MEQRIERITNSGKEKWRVLDKERQEMITLLDKYFVKEAEREEKNRGLLYYKNIWSINQIDCIIYVFFLAVVASLTWP